jgi:transposase
LAQQLIEAARASVGSQHSAAHALGVGYACEDLETLRVRLKQLDSDIAAKLQQHEIGWLLTTIAGIGDNTAACLIAELGDPARPRIGCLCWPLSETESLWQAPTKELVAYSDW